MSIDLEQFHEVFYEESFEGLDNMESGLLELEHGEVDLENINTIFRAAHSIKGGSGTFGFTQISEFTHDMETVLDQMRSGERLVTLPVVNILLSCVDQLRSMLTALKEKTDTDDNVLDELTTKLKKILDNENLADEEESTKAEKAEQVKEPDNKTGKWEVCFKPHLNMMKSGNDSLRLIRELLTLADSYKVELDNSELPDLLEIDPEACYQSWLIELSGEALSENDIREVFDWVGDECGLRVKYLSSHQEPELEKIEKSQAKAETASTDKLRVAEPSAKESSSIRVNIKKVDDLINMVGELVITQSMLSQFGEDEEFSQADLNRLRDGLSLLESHTRELQESVMRIRMMPISFAFQRFPRMVYDLSAQFGKKIELIMSGESTELDKTVLEKIVDPLVHLVRNSLDHGIEDPQQRIEKGKSETGVIELNAYHQGGNIVIEVRDDGAGLNKERILEKAKNQGLVSDNEKLTDEQVYDLIFQAGFSTAEIVSDVSGRGVGMDVVRRNIRELGGTVEVSSNLGQGSVFTIRLPLTLAILDGQLVGVGGEIYILPVNSIVESVQVYKEQINAVVGSAEIYRLREEYIPVVRLHKVFGVDPKSENLVEGLLVVVEAEGKKIAVFVDELLAQQQVVIKSLETNFKKVQGVSGATILGDGTVALIIDVAGLIDLYQKNITGSSSLNKGGGIAA